MNNVLSQRDLPIAWRADDRLAAILIGLVMLLGALITPWGLASSHGSAAVAAFDHNEAWGLDDGHGHSHEDDVSMASDSHAHHSADHSHDNAHALPKDLAGLNGSDVIWRQRAFDLGPWPSLDGLDRPPRT